MATIFNSGGGNWTATSTWLGGMVPTAADDVVLDFFDPALPNQSRQVDLGVAAAGHGLTILDSDVLNLSSSALLSLNVLVIGRGGQLTGSATVQAADTVHNNGAIETTSSAGLVFGGSATGLLNTGTLLASEVGQIRISMGINNSGIVRSEGSGMISLANTNNSGLISAEGSASIQANGAILNSGKIEADHGRITLLGDIANVHGGQLVATDGGFLVEAGAVTGGLGIISSNGTLSFHGSAFQYSTTSVSFQGTGSLNLDNSAKYTGTIQGFGAGDKINILDVGYVPGRDSYDPHSGLLTVGDGTHTTELQLLGALTASSFTFRAGTDGGTSVTYNLLGSPAPSVVGDPALEIQWLYVGYFGRAGDPAGMTYWQDQLIAGHGSPDALAAIAASFSVQAEAKAAYPLLADPRHVTQAEISSFIVSVYENLFGRAPDAAGAEYWQSQVNESVGASQGIGAFILSVIGGAQAQDAVTIANKSEAAAFFSNYLGELHLPYDAADEAFSRVVLGGVTSDQVTVDAAQMAISHFIDTQMSESPRSIFNFGNADNLIVAVDTNNDTYIIGNGNHDTVNAVGAINDIITVGNGNNVTVSAPGAHGDIITIGNGNEATVIANSGSISNTIVLGNGNGDVVDGRSGEFNKITVGDGAGNLVDVFGSNHNSIILGDGVGAVVNANGSNHNAITLGNGDNDVVNASASFTLSDFNIITLGDGIGDKVNASGSKHDVITLGDGDNGTVIAGTFSMIKVGNGKNDTVFSAGNNTIAVGDGGDTIHLGFADVVTGGKGHDNFVFDQSVPRSIGTVIIYDFDPSMDVITINGLLFDGPALGNIEFSTNFSRDENGNVSGLDLYIQDVAHDDRNGTTDIVQLVGVTDDNAVNYPGNIHVT